jgi:hypothetical protein
MQPLKDKNRILIPKNQHSSAQIQSNPSHNNTETQLTSNSLTTNTKKTKKNTKMGKTNLKEYGEACKRCSASLA